jgi:hypothetical protein
MKTHHSDNVVHAAISTSLRGITHHEVQFGHGPCSSTLRLVSIAYSQPRAEADHGYECGDIEELSGWIKTYKKP